jgi:beta-barrel assembly-enhancing protease
MGLRMTRCLSIALMALFLTRCASTQVSDVQPGYRAQAKELDEAGLWFAMDRAEKIVAAAPERITDAPMQEYLDALSCKLAPDLCSDLRVYLIRQPYLNAFMAPNGMMVIFTGTLARSENKAQLAFVMAHEIGHYRSRHSLENWRHLKNISNLMTGLGAVTAGTGAGVIAILGAYANLASFSRDQEREADVLGFRALQTAGFDLQAPAQLWAAAYAEEQANPKGMLSAIFASHPATAERRDRLKLLAVQAPVALSVARQTIATSDARFRALMAPYRAGWLNDELARRNYAQSDVMLTRLSLLKWDLGAVKNAQGALYRKRALPGDLLLAAGAYQAALREPNVDPRTFRDLGSTLKRLGKNSAALDAFREYLKRQPNADDAAMIRSYLNEN